MEGNAIMFQCPTLKGFCFLIPNTWPCYLYFCVEM